MRLSELCIRRPVMTTLVMASLLLAGFFGYRQLPIAAIPRIEVPTITVSVQYPGASPDTMAVSVAAPLERQFATIAGITAITSLSTQGNTQIALEFDLNRNIDAAALDVQSSISVAMARLPIDLPAPPAYRKVNPADTPVIFLALTSDTAQSQEINEFADKVMSPKLSTLPGVAQVNINGAQKRAVRIKYDLDALATRGISVEEVRQAVAALSSVAPIGSIRTGQQFYILEIKGAEPYAAYFKPAIVAWRNGAPIRLQDIAKVEDSVEDDEARTEFNGVRSIIVSVQRQPDANTVAVTDAVHQMLPEFGRTGTLSAKVGAMVRGVDAALPLVTINQTKPIWVTFAVPQGELGALRRALGTKAMADITIRGGSKPTVVQGTIGFVDNQVDKQTGTITARVIAENADEILWPGLSAEVALTVEMKPGMFSVPATAVLPAQQGMITWVIGADNKVAPRVVMVERVVGQTAYLSDGVKPGERVVTDGQIRLAPGASVNVEEPRRPPGVTPASEERRLNGRG